MYIKNGGNKAYEHPYGSTVIPSSAGPVSWPSMPNHGVAGVVTAREVPQPPSTKDGLVGLITDFVDGLADVIADRVVASVRAKLAQPEITLSSEPVESPAMISLRERWAKSEAAHADLVAELEKIPGVSIARKSPPVIQVFVDTCSACSKTATTKFGEAFACQEHASDIRRGAYEAWHRACADINRRRVLNEISSEQARVEWDQIPDPSDAGIFGISLSPTNEIAIYSEYFFESSDGETIKFEHEPVDGSGLRDGFRMIADGSFLRDETIPEWWRRVHWTCERVIAEVTKRASEALQRRPKT